MKLERPIKLSDMVNIACLPSAGEYQEPGTTCVTAGWGHTIEGQLQCIIISKIMKMVIILRLLIMNDGVVIIA